jgi:dipeptidyl aminopeptidase/acylaminoacyl peptidase
MQIKKFVFILSLIACSALALIAQAQSKPKVTLDEFFNSVSYTAVELSPDGSSVVLCTERADWDQQIFRHDLWLYRAQWPHEDSSESKTGSLIQLTQSGHDSEPKWSPDGKWIAFLSERKSAAEKSNDPSSDSGDAKNKRAANAAFSNDKDKDFKDKDDKDEGTTQIYLISPNGGEAFAITQGAEDVHAFAWSSDSQTIFFATRQPWTKTQKDDYKKDWKDVVQYRTAERGDVIYSLNVAEAIANHAAAPAKSEDDSAKESADLTPAAHAIAAMTRLRVDHLFTSPDGTKLGILSNAINQRQEKIEDVEIYLVDLKDVGRALLAANANSAENPAIKLAQPRQLTHNQAVESQPRWAPDSRHILFTVEVGDVSGPYRDLQPHLYSIDTESGAVEQWSKDFIGPIEHYAASPENKDAILTSARIGTEVQLYSASKPTDQLHKLTNWPGTYAQISTATHSSKIAFVYSSLDTPEEIYLADSTDKDKLDQAHAITQFNHLFTERDLPQGKPYKWKADDGTTVEGMLIYPPGKFEQKHLPMFTLIHGGPADADGNHFGADWYDWATFAATNGWLVFRPNYRGSTGYGDKFLMQIVPVIVSRPGKDILEGVDALVKDGIADPDHLVVGGYSYGGYMTNWLITQTTRFKAAVTGAGSVEHVGNWGNDDTTMDDAYFLGGRPWEAAQRYHDEAAIFQIDKVKTPTHMVAGADDIRVAVLEDYLLEHALYSLGIPNALLIFPGEGHSLDKNPWHGKIKVREELKWLEKYAGKPAN